MNEPIGFLGSFNPALLRLTALLTAFIASCCPITRLPISNSNFRSFSRSLVTILATGIPVQPATISAMKSWSTSSLKSVWSACFLSNSWINSVSFFSASLSLEYWISATFSKLLSSLASSASFLRLFINAFCWTMLLISSFSDSQMALRRLRSSLRFAIWVWISFSLSSKPSFFSISFSTFMRISWRSTSSISYGTVFISRRSLEAASSSKSIALSGKNRSVR